MQNLKMHLNAVDKLVSKLHIISWAVFIKNYRKKLYAIGARKLQ